MMLSERERQWSIDQLDNVALNASWLSLMPWRHIVTWVLLSNRIQIFQELYQIIILAKYTR